MKHKSANEVVSIINISGTIWNDDTSTVARAVNVNAEILRNALNRIEELEKIINDKERMTTQI